MRSIFLIGLGAALLLCCTSWGFYAHYRLNRLAIFTLPKGMAAFYEANREYLTAEAISPDRRRYVDSTEAAHHFFNADHYGHDPFHTVPQKWNDAAKKYTADTLNKYGTLPWAIQYQYYKLVAAFKAHDTSAILHHSVYLGHYVADACVPLHLTQNYDGQLTHQTGIHALWESRLPEQFGSQYNWYAGKAHYLENPLWQAFIICRGSFKCVDTALRVERKLNLTFPDSLKYAVMQRGSRKVKDYSPAYCKAYNQALHGMIQRRIHIAVQNIGSYWFSAWVDAGQPNLNKLLDHPPTLAESHALLQEENLYKAGKTAPLPDYGLMNKALNVKGALREN